MQTAYVKFMTKVYFFPWIEYLYSLEKWGTCTRFGDMRKGEFILHMISHALVQGHYHGYPQKYSQLLSKAFHGGWGIKLGNAKT